jgi:hypothetical protein
LLLELALWPALALALWPALALALALELALELALALALALELELELALVLSLALTMVLAWVMVLSLASHNECSHHATADLLALSRKQEISAVEKSGSTYAAAGGVSTRGGVHL